MAAENDGCELSSHVTSDAEDVPEVARVRPFYRQTFANVSLDDAVKMSVDGTAALGIGRDGFTYGETTLSSVWRIFSRIDFSDYSSCFEGGSDDVQADDPQGSRPREGAVVVDLGSGIGNVVVGVALLCAAGVLEGAISAVRGVELLPTLHEAAAEALAGLVEWAEHSAGAGSFELPRALPQCSVLCVDLEQFELADVDVVYMASTVFEPPLLERFARRAAAALRPGARVVTLASRLDHPAFSAEVVVPCMNSWGEEDAYINLRLPDDAQHDAQVDGSPATLRTTPCYAQHDAQVDGSPATPAVASVDGLAPASAQLRAGMPSTPAHTIAVADGQVSVRVELPGVKRASEVDLTVSAEHLHLIAADVVLDIALPHKVLDEEAAAKFDKKALVLTLTMPLALA